MGASDRVTTVWRRLRWSFSLDNETFVGYALLVPILAIVVGLVGYPIGLGAYLSMTDKQVGRSEYSFVGLENFLYLLRERYFLRTLTNTFHYTVTAVFFKAILGLIMALTLNQAIPLRRFFRAAFLLPWVVPTPLSMLAWQWLFDSQRSVITFILNGLGLVEGKINWIGTPGLAMAAVQTINIWHGTPWFGLSFLAALQTVPQELYDAAAIDGAGYFQRFRHVTIPAIASTIAVVTLFSFVATVGNFAIVWLLTRGGPVNSTHVLATYSYHLVIQSALLGRGVAVAIFLLPLIVVMIALQLYFLRRGD